MFRRAGVAALVLAGALVGIGSEPAWAATRTWTGGGSTQAWSEGANWSGSATPSPGDALVFPAPVGAEAVTQNDLPAGTAFSHLTVGDAWRIAGNRFALTNGLATTGDYREITIDAPVDVAADQTWTFGPSSLYLDGGLHLGGHTLRLVYDVTIEGGSAVVIQSPVTGGGTIAADSEMVSVVPGVEAAFDTVLTGSGALRLFDGATVVGDVDITYGSLAGLGTVDGDVVLHSGALISGGVITGGLTMARSSDFLVELTPTPHYDSDVTVGGPVALDGPRLSIGWEDTPAVGSRHVIIDKDSAGRVTGSVASLEEGEHFLARGVEFSISYAGGDGNDVELTVVRHDGVQRLSVAGRRVGEGDGAVELAVTADLRNLTGGRLLRLIGTGGTASNGEDYLTDTWVTLEQGTKNTTARFIPVDDSVAEADETFVVQLWDVALGASGEPTVLRATAEVVIQDDDGYPGSGAVAPATGSAPGGYRFVAADGGMFCFGDASFNGSAAGSFRSPVAGMVEPASGGGYWVFTADGQVANFGSADPVRPVPMSALRGTIVGGASVPGQSNFWRVTSQGQVVGSGTGTPGFGDLTTPLTRPIVGMAATPTGYGYWLVASDGGVFSFGDAGFFGSTGDIVLNKPIVGMAATPSGRGYWLVASDGGVFAFGDAPFLGSTGDIPLNSPIVGVTA